MYKYAKLMAGQDIASCVIRTGDTTIIPFDPANTDYQEYLKWLAEGNQPLPPDGE